MLYRIRKVVVAMSVVGSMNHGMLGAEGMTQKLRKTGKKPCSGGDCATDAKSSKAIQVESHTQTTTKMSTLVHMLEHVRMSSFPYIGFGLAVVFALGVGLGVLVGAALNSLILRKLPVCLHTPLKFVATMVGAEDPFPASAAQLSEKHNGAPQTQTEDARAF